MLEDVAAPLSRTMSLAIELVGIAVISIGVATTLALFVFNLAKGSGFDEAIRMLRAPLGRAILLGLELLVAADIIYTVAVDLTLESVAVLGAIVAIRTFLSFSLEAEIEGQWPWQKAASSRTQVRG